MRFILYLIGETGISGFSQFKPTGRHFGGIFSKPTWERFAQHAPAALASLCVEADEPQGATEEAVAAIKRGG